MKKDIMVIVVMAILPWIVSLTVLFMGIGSAYIESTTTSLWMRISTLDILAWVAFYVAGGSLMVNFLKRR